MSPLEQAQLRLAAQIQDQVTYLIEIRQNFLVAWRPVTPGTYVVAAAEEIVPQGS